MLAKQTGIELKNLSIGYSSGKRTNIVSEAISAAIYKGELTCLLGANGVGKSTLLRTLSAFQPALSGEILIEGKELKTYTEKELSQMIGLVLTERIDGRDMSVRELVGLGRSPYTDFWGRLNQEDRLIVEESIALVKIEHLTDRQVQTLSDGERQKVMIAKALAQQTPIILLDEPTAFLDFQSKVEIMQLLHQLSRKINKTIFLSTHDIELALQIADRIWLMDTLHGIRTGLSEDLALGGTLSHFFAHKGIVFDPIQGLFRIGHEVSREIAVYGSGENRAMLRKALLRNGIAISENTNSEPFIEIKDSEFIYHSDKENQTGFSSIDELLSQLLAP